MVNRLSKREKLVLNQVIKSCEKYELNEDESMRCIRKLFDRFISRRTYYYYKHKMYEKFLGRKIRGRFRKKSKGFLNILRLHDLAITIPEDNKKISKDMEYEILLDYWVHREFFGNDEIPRCDQELYAHTDKVVQHCTAFLHKLDSQKMTCANNFKSVPSNSTIRGEYVRCGKYYCHRCPHGPYFYAYWKGKNSGKLQKKYIGTRDPREKEKTLLEALEDNN